MSWFSNFLTSSIGRKLIMSLTGLFLIVFLIVHLIGNLQLLASDGGEAFNLYAKFMTTNPVIKATSYGLYFFILLHAVQGIILWRQNKAARGKYQYAKKSIRVAQTSSGWAANNMASLGIIIFVFLLIHMYQFWLQMKIGNTEMATYMVSGTAVEAKDLYSLVVVAFKNPIYVVFYVLCMGVISFHLRHGFWSSFQTLGLDHKKYTPVIKMVGAFYSVIVPLGFAIIPILMFFEIV